ncbi:MAG: AMP-binding protein [Ilumatobacteraceae bacterium]|nr:AMP-binding protein [Ilumatobacteraceae bacterium]
MTRTPDTVPGWTFADVFESVAAALPDAPALLHGTLTRTWAEFDRRADGIARFLLDAGAGHQDKVAFYLYNRPEYIELFLACSKASLVHVNTNYRYVDDELVYVWDNADAGAVVFQGAFTSTIERIRDRVPDVHTWLWVDDGEGSCPDWATEYETAAATATTGRVTAPAGRSSDDLVLLYTGGTTGMPKGVMWRQDDLFLVTDRGNRHALPETPDLDESGRSPAAMARCRKPGPIGLPACPLMHGTGLLSSLNTMALGGATVTLESTRFDVEEYLDVIDRQRVKSTIIVGDVFAKPILAALDEHPGRWDISSLRLIVSSGVMWSAESKQALLDHHPGLMLVDSYGSSEALGMGSSISTGDRAAKTASFRLRDDAVVITDDGRLVEPGSGEIGRVGLTGRTPVGYYRDPEKSAATFPVIDGVRYSVPGDFATVEADGSISLLGRGSVCINSGGEKIFPEEVEEVLKRHPAVADAVVVGVPDDRFGQAVNAVVQPTGDANEADLIAHVKAHLAAYKAPKRVFTVASLERAANGKVDYQAWATHAASRP